MAVAKTELSSVLNNSSIHQFACNNSFPQSLLSNFHNLPSEGGFPNNINISFNRLENCYSVNRDSSSSNTDEKEHQPKMNSCTVNPSHIIPSYVSAKTTDKLPGNFESSIVNARIGGDITNNNLQSCQPLEKMTSTTPSNSAEEPRVPVNGESTPVTTTTSEVCTSKSSNIPADSYYCGNRKSSNQSRKNSFFSINHPKFNTYVYGNEHWQDDSLSSSFSSSMSSLPSIPTPPSPASPPCQRPQSLPQNIEESRSTNPSASSNVEVLSASMPDSDFLTTYSYPNSCGSSPRKRVKDQEGFIRRAACICVNESETEVLLVSSKNSREVWIVPGGGLEEGEQSSDAALREAYEEAGVRGKILGYLGLFESQPNVNNSGKKHRTAVYVIRVTKEEEEFPEATLGRSRKWMTYDEAANHLALNRPRQSVYLQLLPALRMSDSARSATISDMSKPKEVTAPSSAVAVDELSAGMCLLSASKGSSNSSSVNEEQDTQKCRQTDSSSSSSETLFPSPN